jgi:hypothetical protein
MDVPAHIPAAATTIEMNRAEKTLRIDLENCLTCRVGFMAVPLFQELTDIFVSRKPGGGCEPRQETM